MSDKIIRPISKAQLAEELNLDPQFLQRQMNKNYYDELVEVGYRKHCRLIPPRVYMKFCELWGHNLTQDED